MKRSELHRHTPLRKATTPLTTASQPLARVVKRRASTTNAKHLYEREFNRLKPVIRERSGGYCELRIPSVCIHVGQHYHHRLLRAQGGKNDEDTVCHCCLMCHNHAHAAGDLAYEMGWLVRIGLDPADVPIRHEEAA